MNGLMTSIILDGIMAMLLMATIFICMRLNKRVRILQNSKSEFSRLIERFDETTRRAQDSIKELQNVSRLVNDQLAERFDKANFLADDLAFMIEKGNKLADQMEMGISAQRSAADSGKAGEVPSPVKRTASGRANKVSSEAVLDELTAAVEQSSSPPPFKRRGLEAMMSKVAGKSGDDTASTTASDGPKLKSRSERELYDAIRNKKV